LFREYNVDSNELELETDHCDVQLIPSSLTPPCTHQYTDFYLNNTFEFTDESKKSSTVTDH